MRLIRICTALVMLKASRRLFDIAERIILQYERDYPVRVRLPKAGYIQRGQRGSGSSD
ncbi:hypothetical protein C8J35_103494 [Rhizobium sp. PP-F2F-G38]|nr:hypothetical protein C8J35_103494 [Rhizobium sp. PP-F2F-G38]